MELSKAKKMIRDYFDKLDPETYAIEMEKRYGSDIIIDDICVVINQKEPSKKITTFALVDFDCKIKWKSLKGAAVVGTNDSLHQSRSKVGVGYDMGCCIELTA